MFFPMLKAFASDERFTYENLVDTADFTEFVQQYTGLELQGFFDMYLKSIRVPKVKVAKKGKNGYQVSLSNTDFTVPVEIKTSNGYERHMLSSKPVLVRSAGPIEVDPKGWYLLEKK